MPSAVCHLQHASALLRSVRSLSCRNPTSCRAMELVLCNRRIPLQSAITLGRADLPSCGEAIFVSRKQCTVQLADAPDDRCQVLLHHTGSANPILIQRHNTPPGTGDLLQPGQQTLLSDMDSFSLLCTRPELAVTVQRVQPGAPHSSAGTSTANEQQPAASPSTQLLAAASLTTGDPEKNACTTAADAVPLAVGSSNPTRRLQHVVASSSAQGASTGAEEPFHPPAAATAAGAAAGGAAAMSPLRPPSPASAPVPSAAAPVSPPRPAAAAAAAAAVAQHPLPRGIQPVMLLLVGVPGSGKSTFCEHLQQRSLLPWVRVNQDAVKQKSSKRQVCEQQAAAALRQGQCVVLDRCHVTPDQRQHFIALARSHGVRCHAVVLQLPAALCRQRAAARQAHEGGVQGPGAARVVGMMQGTFAKAGLPQLSEGLDSITLCQDDAQVAAALTAWASLGAPAPAAAAAGGQPASQSAAAAATAALGLAASQQQQQPMQGQQQHLLQQAPGQTLVLEAEVLTRLRHLQTAGGQQPAAQQGASSGGSGGAKGGNIPGVDPAPSSKRTRRISPPQAASQQQQQPEQRNAFAVLMKGAAASTGAGTQQRGAPSAAATSQQQQQGGGRAGWNLVLANVARNPAAHIGTQTIFYVDDQVVGMVDGYPKAQQHYLILARAPGLDKVSQLRGQHVALLQHMRAVAVHCIALAQQGRLLLAGQLVPPLQQQPAAAGSGQAAAAGPAGTVGAAGSLPESGVQQQTEHVATLLQQQLPSLPPGWLLGFHSVPSMAQLHLHVLTDDLCSPSLKHKKHWHSFTTPFFLKVDDALQQLRLSGAVRVDVAAAEQLLKGPLVCHKCGAVLGNMPQLKQHIQGHLPVA